MANTSKFSLVIYKTTLYRPPLSSHILPPLLAYIPFYFYDPPTPPQPPCPHDTKCPTWLKDFMGWVPGTLTYTYFTTIRCGFADFCFICLEGTFVYFYLNDMYLDIATVGCRFTCKSTKLSQAHAPLMSPSLPISINFRECQSKIS